MKPEEYSKLESAAAEKRIKELEGTAIIAHLAYRNVLPDDDAANMVVAGLRKHIN
jgi:hypothetical protein